MSRSERTARLRAAQVLPAEFMDEVDREELREAIDRAHCAHRSGVHMRQTILKADYTREFTGKK